MIIYTLYKRKTDLLNKRVPQIRKMAKVANLREIVIDHI